MLFVVIRVVSCHLDSQCCIFVELYVVIRSIPSSKIVIIFYMLVNICVV